MNQALVIVVEVTAVLALSLLGARLATGARAAVRHLILASAFGVALFLPLATLVSPTIPVEVAALPARTAEAVTFSPAAAAPEGRLSSADNSAIAIPPALAPTSAMPISLTTWLLVAWAVIASITLAPVWASLWHVRSLRRRGRYWAAGSARLDQLAGGSGRWRPQVLLHDSIGGPITAGLVRPLILLPADAGTWSERHLTNALLHELEHVRRRDWAVHLVARATCALYWFHPLAWVAWRALRLEAERACDDAVLERTDAPAYAEQLLDLARRLADRPDLPGLQMASGSNLASRIKAMLDGTIRRGRTGKLVIAGVAIVALAVVVALAPLRPTGPLLTPSAQTAAGMSTASSPAASWYVTAPKDPDRSVSIGYAPPNSMDNARPFPSLERALASLSPEDNLRHIVLGYALRDDLLNLQKDVRSALAATHPQEYAALLNSGTIPPAWRDENLLRSRVRDAILGSSMVAEMKPVLSMHCLAPADVELEKTQTVLRAGVPEFTSFAWLRLKPCTQQPASDPVPQQMAQSAVGTPLPRPECQAPAGRAAEQIEGRVKAGQRFREPTPSGWVVSLVPTEHGWHLRVGALNKGDDNYARLTPPWHFVPNATEIDGWHFRNLDNTGPNDGSVNAPGNMRRIIFSPQVGHGIEYNGSATPQEDVAAVREFGQGWLYIDEYQLTPVGRGTQASFESLAFTVCLTWPAAATPPRIDREDEAIARVKHLLVRELDPSLNSSPFRYWFMSSVAAPSAPISYELNDCGEQSGGNDGNRDIPLCVEVRTTTRAGATAAVSILVGSIRSGVRSGKPAIWQASLQQGDRFHVVRTLGDLPHGFPAE